MDDTCCTPSRLATYCNSCKLYVDFYDGDLEPSNHEGPVTTEQKTPGICTTPVRIVDYCFSCGATWNERDGEIDLTNHI